MYDTEKPDFCNLLGPVYNMYITSILAISILAMFFLVPKIAKIEGWLYYILRGYLYPYAAVITHSTVEKTGILGQIWEFLEKICTLLVHFVTRLLDPGKNEIWKFSPLSFLRGRLKPYS